MNDTGTSSSDSCTATTGLETEPLTSEKLKGILALIPPCPYAEYMKKNRCDPKDGWVMIIPRSTPCIFASGFPAYVRLSSFVYDITLINTRVCGDLGGSLINAFI